MNVEERKNVMPERLYSLDNNMSLEKIIQAKKTGDFLIAHVLYFDSKHGCLKVNLGNHINGEIPLDEFTIYSTIRTNGNISASVYSLIGQNVCTCVREICDESKIILSRKENMIKAFNLIAQSNDKIFSCLIQNVVPYGLFVDVGHGINGFIHTQNLVLSRIDNPMVVGFKPLDSINAKITSINTEKYQIALNHKCLVDNLANSLNSGDVVPCTTLASNENHGYFVYLNENTPALMDEPNGLNIKYGSRVSAVVKPFRPDHPDRVRLRFLSFIS